MSASKRFKSLEETFNLDNLDIAESDDADEENTTTNTLPEPIDETAIDNALEYARKLNNQIVDLKGFADHDKEMDELADLAVQAHKDLQDLGMNVEIRHAGEIFSSSSQMLKIAVDAKHNKVDKKLRLLKLQLDKMKIELTFKEDDNTVDGQAHKLDRNELMKQLKQINADDK